MRDDMRFYECLLRCVVYLGLGVWFATVALSQKFDAAWTVFSVVICVWYIYLSSDKAWAIYVLCRHILEEDDDET